MSWQGTKAPDRLFAGARLLVHYADLPLIYTVGGVREAELVKHRLTTDLSLAFSAWKRLQIALAFPITLYQQGEQAQFPQPILEFMPPPKAASAGQEDLRLLIKGVFWRNEIFGLGGVGDLALPTGNADSYLGSRPRHLWPNECGPQFGLAFCLYGTGPQRQSSRRAV